MYGNSWNMMGWGGLHGIGGLGLLFWLLVLALLAVGIISLMRSPSAIGAAQSTGRDDSLDLLELRYARGEIGRNEYLQKRRDILSRR